MTPNSPLASSPEPPIDPGSLQRSLRSPRTLFSAVCSLLCGLLALIALLPLFSVLGMLLYRGGGKVFSAGLTLFTELPPAAGMVGGGIGNALIGTVVVVTIASLLSVPVGVLGGVYLAEFGPRSRLASVVRFTAKLLTGLPSVLAGLVVFAAVVVFTGFSALAGGMALAILMLPTVLITAEDALKMVPQRMREAAFGMGCTPTQAVWLVVLPTALPGILTGVMLAVARAAGETAPLLFTAFFSNYWMTARLHEPTPSLAVLIYNFSGSPFRNQQDIAWAASLVVVTLILLANISAQIYTTRTKNR
ncbi:MAG: phosphate ABC transporter permease PstA [Gemmataceae bacterium]